VGEEQDLSAAAHELEGLPHDGVGRDGDDGGVQGGRGTRQAEGGNGILNF